MKESLVKLEGITKSYDGQMILDDLNLDIYQNDLMIIHGTKDTTVPFAISKKYLQGFSNPQFYPIEGATHNYDALPHIKEVIKLTYQFFTDTL